MRQQLDERRADHSELGTSPRRLRLGPVFLKFLSHSPEDVWGLLLHVMVGSCAEGLAWQACCCPMKVLIGWLVDWCLGTWIGDSSHHPQNW